MKDRRPFFYLLAVVLIAASVWFLERPTTAPRDDVRLLQFYPDLDSAIIQKIQITRLMDGVVLLRDGEGWVVLPQATPLSEKIRAQENAPPPPAAEPVPANPQKVYAAIRALKELESQSLLSRDAQSQPQLQVNEIGTRVQADDAAGQKLLDIYIGKTGPDLLSTAVRREGEPEVYLVRGYLAGRFPATVEQWKK